MATTRSFSAMLNDYLPNALLKEELVKRDYLLTKVEKDESWISASATSGEGALVVPFKAAGASSIAFGSLTADDDVAEDIYVRGRITVQPEAWGTMIFNQRDLMEHGKLSESNFLKLLPDSVEDFVQYFKGMVSLNLLNGSHIAKATADGDASGLITVAQPDRFVIGQKVYVDDDDNTATVGYVRTINMNTGVLVLYSARSAGSVVNLSSYTTAQNAKLYGDGQQASGFSNLRSMLLSAANGGDTNLYGVAKTAYPYLQAINIDGSGITAVNIMESLFDAFTTVRRLGKGAPSDVIMSYTNWGSCMKVIEGSKGAFNVTPGSQKASQYGWDEIQIGSVKGSLKLVATQEMDDDVIYIIDWRALKFYSNGFFRKNKSPDGNEYFVKRATTGYQYIIDICLFGDLVLLRPSYCGVIHTVAY